MDKVTVLLSTYNGEKYVEQQISSILNQVGVDVDLLVRDDGSTDRTPEILSKYKANSNVVILEGSNIGWRESFITLLFDVNRDKNRFYAFADQDDIWDGDKLYYAVSKIGHLDGPQLYHSNSVMVDANLKFIANKYSTQCAPKTNMPEAFFDGIGTGSTMVFNDRFLGIVREYRPSEELSHDAYLMALANLLGCANYDSHPHMKYRRHNGTATGFGKQNRIGRPTLVMRYRRFKKTPTRPYSIRARQLLSGYQSYFDVNQVRFLTYVANYNNNFIYRMRLFLWAARASTFKKTMIIKFRVVSGDL